MTDLPRRLTFKLPPLTDEQYAIVANTAWTVVHGLGRAGGYGFEAVPDGQTLPAVLDRYADLDSSRTRWQK